VTEPEPTAARPGPEPLGASSLRAAGVVHDVNQMLAVIIGRAELLLRRGSGQQPHLEAILLAARDAGLMLGRLEVGPAGAVDAGGAPATALVRVVDEAALLVLPPDGQWGAQDAREAATGRWTLENCVGGAAAAAVPAAVVREVLANLLLNALGAMPDGGHVVVTSERCGGSVCLRVADSGPGLPDGEVARIFEAGFTTSGRQGRGIGLAACRQLLEAHGGALTALPQGGPGAIFIASVPMAAGDSPEPALPVPTPEHLRSELNGLSVVVVDDEAAVREMLADVLGELGCRVVCHRDGASALAAGAPGEAAVALVDRRLPGMDGFELSARLRERRASLAVIVMTGWDRDELPARAAAFDFTVRKPLGMDALRELLARAAALHEARRRDEPRAEGGS
jgi:CheY-like chemotaxis protein